jgi:hypothetical protein
LFNCSIEAALNVSPAAKMQDNLFFSKSFAIFAIEVVFPVPFIPQNNTT